MPLSCAAPWASARPAASTTAKLLNLSTDLPLIIEIVDSEAKISAFLPELDTMISGGLVTMEKVKVLHYRGTNR